MKVKRSSEEFDGDETPARVVHPVLGLFEPKKRS